MTASRVIAVARETSRALVSAALNCLLVIRMRDIGEWVLRKLKLTGDESISPETAPEMRNVYRGIIARIEQEVEAVEANTPGRGWSAIVTASRVGEGASTIAGNVAWCLAQARAAKVLLVEAVDPGSNPPYGFDREAGLVDVLDGRADVEDTLRSVGDDDFFLLPFGKPGAVLPIDVDMSPLMGKLRDEFPFIIVDGPPLNAEADLELWLPRLDGVVLVVEAHRTRRETLEGIRFLREAEAPILGVVLNKKELFVPDWLYARV